MRVVLTTALAAVLLSAAPARAADPFTIGTGHAPGVAVDTQAAYIAWRGNEPNTTTLNYCRLPRGADACDVKGTVTTGGTSLSRPFVIVAGNVVRIVQYRYGFSQGDFGRAMLYTSTDRGATFAAGGTQVGTTPFDEAAYGPGDALSVVTNAYHEGGVFSNLSLSAPNADTPRFQVYGGERPYNGAVGLVDGAPLAVFVTGSGQAAFRRYTGSGDIHANQSWSGSTDIGYADYPKLAGGPTGLFMLAGTEADGLSVRKYNGTTFGAPVSLIASGAEDPQAHLSQDPSGRLHAAFPRVSAAGQHLVYATSDNGSDWQSGDLHTIPQGSFASVRVAAAEDHIGVVVWVNPGEPDVLVLPVAPPPRLPAAAPAKATRVGGGKVRVKISGRLSLPAGIDADDGCEGRLRAVVRRGSKQVASRAMTINDACRYRATITIPRSKAKSAKRLGLRLTFLGNDVLRRTGRAYRVRVR